VEARRDGAILRASLESLTEARLRPVQHGRDRRQRPRRQGRALYGRRPSKAARVVDAVSAWREEVAWLSISDTRSLQGHIEAPIANVPDLDEADNQQRAVVVGLAAAASRDPGREDRALRRVGPSNCARPRRVH
jgi:hypothetical protein